jgi:hypothetical protein
MRDSYNSDRFRVAFFCGVNGAIIYGLLYWGKAKYWEYSLVYLATALITTVIYNMVVYRKRA